MNYIMCIIAVFYTSLCFAQEVNQDDYLTLGDVTTKLDGAEFAPEGSSHLDFSSIHSIFELTTKPSSNPADLSVPKRKNFLAGKSGTSASAAGDMVAVGKAIYSIIKDGKPVLKTSYEPISVIPKSRSGFPVDVFDMEGWSNPVSRTAKVVYKNKYGTEVVSLRYKLIYSYGGRYQGKGSYLTALQVVPVYSWLAWGWNLGVTVRLMGVQNQGSKQNPKAGVVINVTHKVETLVEAIERTDSYFITGDGTLRPI